MDFFLNHEPIGPSAPDVISETLDGEAIIMDHRTGHYFNALGVGGIIWAAIEDLATLDEIVARVVEAYEVDENEARASTIRFLQTLSAHGLIEARETQTAKAGGPASKSAMASRAPFAEPELGVHTDLADMLLLDPIHDVDESGWPAPAQAHTQAKP